MFEPGWINCCTVTVTHCSWYRAIRFSLTRLDGRVTIFKYIFYLRTKESAINVNTDVEFITVFKYSNILQNIYIVVIKITRRWVNRIFFNLKMTVYFRC